MNQKTFLFLLCCILVAGGIFFLTFSRGAPSASSSISAPQVSGKTTATNTARAENIVNPNDNMRKTQRAQTRTRAS